MVSILNEFLHLKPLEQSLTRSKGLTGVSGYCSLFPYQPLRGGPVLWFADAPAVTSLVEPHIPYYMTHRERETPSEATLRQGHKGRRESHVGHP